MGSGILRAIINCRSLNMRSLAPAVLLALFAAVSASADPGPVAIAIRDHAFVPSEVKIPAGAKVELTIRNEQTVPAEFESASLHREKVVSPGSAISVYVGPLQPGRYEFFDDFHPATRGLIVAE
jgi:plastocyanin